MITEAIKNAVYKEIKKIPRGKTKTYKEIANKIGLHPRTIGAILRQNYDENIPCHRVIMSSGGLGSYNRGIKMKKYLLKKEGAI